MSKREQWLVSAWLVEETGYERWQTSKKKKKKERRNQWYCSLCWKLPDGVQSFVFCSQIVTE